ncbi:MAG: rhodanese-like domain-containing protein [Verrucomicrobiota bacterium]
MPVGLPELTGSLNMGELLEHYPGARRALFRNFHIGGCSQCGFSDDESLKVVCERNEQIDLMPVFDAIRKAHEDDEKLLIDPSALKTWRSDNKSHLLIDTRSREEHEAVTIEGSVLLNQDLSTELINAAETDVLPLVFFDHQGRYVLDTASYFIGHGREFVYCLQGGIDRWARDIDKNMRRYHLE